VNGVQFEIVGAPVAGDSFTVNSSEKQGLLTTIEKFIYGLRNINDTAAGKESFNNLLESTIANLDSAETSVLEVRGQVGARLNTIEASAEQLKVAEILTHDVVNTLEAVDYAETVSLLTVQQFTLEAAYSSFSKITSLSLFERI
jgi:flagellar hook-associated protein 3 FlgL